MVTWRPSQDFDNNRKYRRFSAPLLALALAACANAQSVQESSLESGVGRSFQAPYEQTKAAVYVSLDRLKLKPTASEERPDGLAVQIARPPRVFSWGEVGRIFVEKSPDKPTIVRVVYENRFALQFAQSNFPRYLFQNMDEVLAAQGVTEKSTEAPAKSSAPPSEP